MARRVSLPTADELFRRTEDEADGARAARGTVRAVPDQPETEERPAPRRRASGRVRHDEKMTVYITAEELLDLEHARLTLRADYGVAVDRGRLVRAAIALALADLEQHGAESALLHRLEE